MIEKESERKKYLNDNEIKDNLTTIFLLPMFKYEFNFFPIEFISAYLLDELKPKIVLCFNNSDSQELKDTILELQENEHFFSEEYDDNEIVIKLLLPKRFDIDFGLYKIGRWSKLSIELKEILVNYYGKSSGEGKRITIWDALYPNHQSLQFQAKRLGVSISELPNGEVFDIPDISREWYRKIEEFIKYEKKYAGNK